MIKFFTAIFLLIAIHGSGQLVNITQKAPCLAVFATTDGFDSSYQTILESSFHQPSPDMLKLVIGNDLAYYWHTRNLGKAHALAYQLLAIASTTRKKVSEGRLYETETAKGTGFKTELVNLLIQQLDDTLKIDTNNGTYISTIFKYNKLHHKWTR